MDTPLFYVGIDVASQTLAVALTHGPGRPVAPPLAVANDPDGFAAFAVWLADHGAAPETTLVCLESTGVYGEALCYWLHAHGFRVVVEDAAKVRRAMPVAGAKTDALDAQRIADYAARFLDELRPWAPAEAAVEQLRTLLTMREQLTRERNAKQNAQRMLARKVVQTPLANRIADDAVAYLKDRIAEIDAEVRRVVGEHRPSARPSRCWSACPGSGSCWPPISAWRPAGSRARFAEAGVRMAGNLPAGARERVERAAQAEESGLRAIRNPKALVPRVHPACLDRRLATPGVLRAEEGGGEERAAGAQQRRQQAAAGRGGGAA